MDSRRVAPTKRKTKPSLTRSFVVTVAVGIPGALLANTAGCGSSGQPNNAAGGTGGPGGVPQPGQPGVMTGTCTNEGEVRACHTDLGATNVGTQQYHNCFYGSQSCTAGVWSGCGGDGMITGAPPNPAYNADLASGAAGNVHTQGFGAFCGDHVCNGIETCATCVTDCGACTPGSGSTGASICTQDPCDADCRGWGPSTTAGLPVAPSTTGIQVLGFGQIKNGQIQKLALDSCNDSKPCDRFDQYSTPSSYFNCQMDTYCSLKALGGTGCCEQFDPGGTYQTESTPGPLDLTGPGTSGVSLLPDLTIGPGCSDVESDKYRYFPICNRGSAPVPLNTVIRVSYVNPVSGFPNNACTAGACTLSNFDCSVKLDPLVYTATSPLGSVDAALGLLPGTCVLLDTQAAGMSHGGGNCSQPSGDKWMMVNCDGSINEGNLDPTLPNAAGASPPQPTAVANEVGCGNNWTDHSPDNNPPSCTGAKSIAFLVQYHATCPTGYQVVWNKLTYHSATPQTAKGLSEILFEVATAPDPIPPAAFDPTTFSDFYEVAEAKWTQTEGNTGTVVSGTSCTNSNKCFADPENCGFTYPNTGAYQWLTNTNGPSPPAPLGDGLPAATTTSPSVCPKDIENQLERAITNTPFPGAGPTVGAKLARSPYLNLRLTLKPTPDNVAPTLRDWSLSYQCISAE